MVLIHEVASEDIVLLGLIDKLLELIDRAELHLDVWILARLLRALMEHVADVLRLHIHLNVALILVDDDFLGIAVIHHLLEVRVGCRLGDAAVRRTSAREVEQSQCEDGEDVDPVHVELGHIHLRPIATFVVYLIIIHLAIYDLRIYDLHSTFLIPHSTINLSLVSSSVWHHPIGAPGHNTL